MSKGKLAAAFLAVIALAACGGSPQASAAACKHAMRGQLAAAIANGTKGTEPAACKGLPTRTLERLAMEVLTGR